MTWDYRLIEFPDNGAGRWVELREVHYDEAGAVKMWSEDAATIGSETVEGCREVLAMMSRAFDLPVLRAEDLPGYE